MATLDNFTNPRAAENDYYPDGAFGYSSTQPSILRFRHPVEFHAIWLKKHRSTEFYLKNSAANYLVSAYLDGKLVLQAQVLASSILWKHYQPHETLLIDMLVIPPGMDFDNLLVGVDMGSEELMIKQQLARKHHQNYLIEKTYNLKKLTPSGLLEKRTHNKKDPGYQVLTTAHTNPESNSDPAQEFLGAFGISDGTLEKLTQTLENEASSTNMVSDSVMDLLKALKSTKPSASSSKSKAKEFVRPEIVFHPINHIEKTEEIKDDDERAGEMFLHKRNSIIYLMLDFMNYIEFGDSTKYFYGKSIFEQIKNINKIKHAGSDREYATIFILQNFKEYKL